MDTKVYEVSAGLAQTFFDSTRFFMGWKEYTCIL